jgi:hypothetical protein
MWFILLPIIGELLRQLGQIVLKAIAVSFKLSANGTAVNI